MSIKRLFAAFLLGLVATAATTGQVSAQNTLSIMRGSTSGEIKVTVNRAIVVESAQVFAELSVANPAIADIATLSDRTIYVLGKTPGATTLTLIDQEGRLIANVDIRVSPDIAEFKERLSEILPDEPIEVRTANNGIVLSGRVSGARKAARAMELAAQYASSVTNLMMIGGTQQVLLKVRFAEMQRSVAKSLGTSLGILGDNFAVGTGLYLDGEGGGGDITLSSDATGAAGVGFSLGSVAIEMVLEALETNGMARTLAEPNLVAISGQKASFLAGGEYPVPVREDGGIGIEYRPFGIQLAFEPTVVDDDVIALTITTEVSSIDEATTASIEGFPVSAFSVRRASTAVEMRDGESFAIAGLMQEDFSDTVSRVPWIGDVPIIGALFRSASYQRRQTELVIIVTPHLVAPTLEQALALPTDKSRIPTEEELFLMGITEGTTGYVME